MRHILEIGDYFRRLVKLEHVHVYIKNLGEKLDILEYRKNHAFVKSAENIQKLIKNLNFINDDNESHFEKSLKASKQQSKQIAARNKLLSQTLAGLESIFDSNDLILIKSNLNDLLSVINLYNNLKEKYFRNKKKTSSNSMLSNSSSIIINVKFYRYIFWIPEHTEGQYYNNNLFILNAINKRSIFKIFILNWHFDLDWTLSQLINGIVSNSTSEYAENLENCGKFSIKLLNSDHYGNSSTPGANLLAKLQFKVTDDKIKAVNEDDANIPFLFASNNYNIQKTKKKKTTTTTASAKKLTYRIVSNQIEPFVIVSQLDEHLVSKDECKDGLPCLDIDADIYNDNNFIFKNRSLNGN